jgi:hypothetical protein
MSILILGSNNPMFSHVTGKNPATIRANNKAYRREVRKGVAYGWFAKGDQEFRLWFKDSDMETSFGAGDGEFEYLDCTRYGNAYLPIALIANCLSEAADNHYGHDATADENGTPFKAYVQATIRVVNRRYLEQMANHFKDVTIESVPVTDSAYYYHVSIQGNTVSQVLNVLQVICILQCLCDDDTYVRMDLSAAKKFAAVFNRVNTPYYPRYLFQTKAISNRDTFLKLLPDLQAEGMVLNYGDTRWQRFDMIKTVLRGGLRLVDIGAGEMFQAMRLSKVYDRVIVIDADEERSGNNHGKITGRKMDNMQAIHAEVTAEYVTDNELMFEDADVLLTEVVEHMEYEQADALLKAILKTNHGKVVVTCPNKDFNQFYLLGDDEFRHSDHKFEQTFEEFCDWMCTLAAGAGVLVSCIQIGDSVNDISTSSMAVFTKGEN